MTLPDILTTTVTRKASDLHLIDGYPPILRINGELAPVAAMPELNQKDIRDLIFPTLSDNQKLLIETNKEMDYSMEFATGTTKCRFRVQLYFQKGSLTASLRLISSDILSIEELNLPAVLNKFTLLRSGFILITGPTGQGKSTSIASIIQTINRTRCAHIVTVEDPVEYEFPKGKCIISQREMYQDTHSWRNALKYVVREDPDIVFIGEMRDYETISSVLTIAETGHLVFSTLHTNSASQTIDRIIDIFPSQSKDQVRMQLSMVISGIVTQKLVPAVTGGRIPVCEVLLSNDSIRNTIREGNVHLIDNIIQTSVEEGMLPFEMHLKQRVEANQISHETALQYAIRVDRYLQLVQG